MSGYLIVESSAEREMGLEPATFCLGGSQGWKVGG
jgi:hypothetical protein